MAHATTVTPDSLARALRRHLTVLVRQLARARRGDARGVHRARVASRRLREALPVAGAIAGADVRAVRRDVRRLTQALGDVRELDVARGVLDDQVRAHDWPGGVASRVGRHLDEVRAERARRMVAAIKHVDEKDLRSGVEAIAATVLSATRTARADARLASRLHAQAHTLTAALRHVGTLYAPDPLHAVRLAAKKMRYTLELARAASDRPAGRDVATLRALQAQLGRLHDLQVLQEHVHIVAAEAAPDRRATRMLETMAVSFEAECRELHAAFLRLAPRVQAVADRVTADVTAQRRKSARMIRMAWPDAAVGRRRKRASA